jgi:hypothetical protein
VEDLLLRMDEDVKVPSETVPDRALSAIPIKDEKTSKVTLRIQPNRAFASHSAFGDDMVRVET